MLKGNAQFFVLLIIVAQASTGCTGLGGTVPVEGKVTLDKKPLANATVMFAPTKANGPGPFVGTTDDQGKFKLGLLESSRAGAAVGEYSVIIATVKSDPNENSIQATKEIVPAEYRNGSKKYPVPPGGTKEANFDMTSR
jgi:hypothetical protein